MHYYKMAFQKYAQFTGRSTRSEYWFYVLFNILATFACIVIDFLIELPIFTLLYALASIIPSIAVLVRRLHDTGRSGWWYFIGMIPFVGFIVLLAFLFSDSQPGRNQWGENPKEVIASDFSGPLVVE